MFDEFSAQGIMAMMTWRSIDECVHEAVEQLNVDIDECEIHVWPQQWSNTACGADEPGTFSGCAMTKAHCVVVICNKVACVFHNGEFAYRIHEPTEEFWCSLDHQIMPGASEDRSRLDRAVNVTV